MSSNESSNENLKLTFYSGDDDPAGKNPFNKNLIFLILINVIIAILIYFVYRRIMRQMESYTQKVLEEEKEIEYPDIDDHIPESYPDVNIESTSDFINSIDQLIKEWFEFLVPELFGVEERDDAERISHEILIKICYSLFGFLKLKNNNYTDYECDKIKSTMIKLPSSVS